MEYPFFTMIPIPGKHGGIVIGKGGSYLYQLGTEFGVKITKMTAQPERKRPTPYLLIESYFEKNVNMASIRVLELIVKSMEQVNLKMISQVSKLGHESQHTNLLLCQKDEQILVLTKQLGNDVESVATNPPTQPHNEDTIVVKKYNRNHLEC